MAVSVLRKLKSDTKRFLLLSNDHRRLLREMDGTTETNDFQLLQQYVQKGSEDAFKALVDRHLKLVYSVALSRIVNESGGITVNKFLETSVQGVWAAGDIASYPDQIFHRRMRMEHWDNAVEQGRVAMRNIMGKLQPFIHVTYFFSDVFDLSYEFWGDADGHDQVVYRSKMNQKQLSVWWLKKQTLCAALIMNRPEEERAVAPRWILRRPRLDPKALQNARSLKSLDTTFGRLD